MINRTEITKALNVIKNVCDKSLKESNNECDSCCMYNKYLGTCMVHDSFPYNWQINKEEPEWKALL